jgi:hypothetical protein
MASPLRLAYPGALYHTMTDNRAVTVRERE